MSDDPAGGPRPGADDFDPKQHVWDGHAWWTADRERWWDGTTWQPKEVPRPSGAVGRPARKQPPGYWRDFWLGFGGTIVGNLVLLGIIAVIVQNTGQTVQQLALALPWLLNFGFLIFFGIKRHAVLFGMLTAYGVAFGIALLAGIVFLVVCFVAVSSGGGSIP